MRGSLFRCVLALMFLVLGIFMALPVNKPFLWILDDLGNHHIGPFVWPVLSLGGAISLWHVRRPQFARLVLGLAFVLLGVVGVAGFLTQGPNILSLWVLPLMWGCGQLNQDIKAGWHP